MESHVAQNPLTWLFLWTYLAKTCGKKLGKTSVTGYCIRFKTLKNISIEILKAAIRFGCEAQKTTNA
jgi:hypothetical protein